GQRLLLVVIFVALWALAASRMPAFVLPGPLKVWSAMQSLFVTPTFFHDVGMTLYRVAMGFILATIVGTPLGLCLGSNRTLAAFFEPLLSVTNTISSAIWAVFAIIWFGIS